MEKKVVKIVKETRDIIRTCALPECDKTFELSSHNKKFHSPACCRIATNRRLLEKYHASKKGLEKGRICANATCKTVLSIYNDDKICNLCKNEIGV